MTSSLRFTISNTQPHSFLTHSDQLARVTAVSPDQFKSLWIFLLESVENRLSFIPVLITRGMNNHSQNQPHRVYQDVVRFVLMIFLPAS